VPLFFLERFGVNGDAVNLRKLFLHTVFQRRGHVVDLRDGQLAPHRAMARNQDVVLHLAHAHVVAIHELAELQRQLVQKLFDRARKLFHFPAARIRRGNVCAQRFDVDINFYLPVSQLANFFFQVGSLAVRIAQAQMLVHFQVQFDEKLSILLDRGQVMNGKPHLLCHGANRFKKVFSLWRARLRMHHHVRRNDFPDTFFDGVA